MAQVHEKLYQSDDLQHVNTHEFICALIEDLKTSQSHQQTHLAFSQEIERINLNLDQAILVGQIFSELLSNAIKHAFPDGRSGMIEISLRRIAAGQIELSLADNGIGLPEDFDSSKAESLGWQRVHTLAGKLDAKIELEQSDACPVRLLFPEVEA